MFVLVQVVVQFNLDAQLNGQSMVYYEIFIALLEFAKTSKVAKTLTMTRDDLYLI